LAASNQFPLKLAAQIGETARQAHPAGLLGRADLNGDLGERTTFEHLHDDDSPLRFVEGTQPLEQRVDDRRAVGTLVVYAGYVVRVEVGADPHRSPEAIDQTSPGDRVQPGERRGSRVESCLAER
jgi:hypothetical protein